jgi:hypothetical protein
MTKSKPEDDSMRVLTSGTCETLTGSTRVSYHVGSMPDSKIYLRVHGNTGGGFFSNEWIAYEGILQAFKKRPAGKAITSILLHPLLKGRSVNTPAFLLAVLLHEKILRPVPGKLRRHELVSDSAFLEKVDRLRSGGGDANGKTSGKPAGSAPRKKRPATSSRKKAKAVRGT